MAPQQFLSKMLYSRKPNDMLNRRKRGTRQSVRNIHNSQHGKKINCAMAGNSSTLAAKWMIRKSRILEAGFVDVRMRMRNRELGEYENTCYVLGYVLDNEFDIARDPIAVSCTD